MGKWRTKSGYTHATVTNHAHRQICYSSQTADIHRLWYILYLDVRAILKLLFSLILHRAKNSRRGPRPRCFHIVRPGVHSAWRDIYLVDGFGTKCSTREWSLLKQFFKVMMFFKFMGLKVKVRQRRLWKSGELDSFGTLTGYKRKLASCYRDVLYASGHHI